MLSLIRNSFILFLFLSLTSCKTLNTGNHSSETKISGSPQQRLMYSLTRQGTDIRELQIAIDDGADPNLPLGSSTKTYKGFSGRLPVDVLTCMLSPVCKESRNFRDSAYGLKTLEALTILINNGVVPGLIYPDICETLDNFNRKEAHHAMTILTAAYENKRLADPTSFGYAVMNPEYYWKRCVKAHWIASEVYADLSEYSKEVISGFQVGNSNYDQMVTANKKDFEQSKGYAISRARENNYKGPPKASRTSWSTLRKQGLSSPPNAITVHNARRKKEIEAAKKARLRRELKTQDQGIDYKRILEGLGGATQSSLRCPAGYKYVCGNTCCNTHMCCGNTCLAAGESCPWGYEKTKALYAQ